MVGFSLCSNFPQALALLVSCHLIHVYPGLYLVRSSMCCAGEIKKALAILLFCSHVSGGISEAFCLCTCHEVVSNLPQGCVPLYYAILLFAYFVVLPLTWLGCIYTLSLNNGIATLIIY